MVVMISVRFGIAAAAILAVSAAVTAKTRKPHEKRA